MDHSINQLNIQHFDTAEEAAKDAGESLGKILLGNIKDQTLLLLSGGSALKILDFVDENALGEQLTITVLDERFSTDPKINNFAQLQESDFYVKALEHDASFLGTLPRKSETMANLAERLEANLKQWRKENPSGKIIATLGMGPDGHTAGIMPFPENEKLFENLFNNDNWVASFSAAGKNPYPDRITATLTFIRQINQAIGFVSGTEKKPALDKVLSKQAGTAQLPAMIFWEIKNLEIFTDIN